MNVDAPARALEPTDLPAGQKALALAGTLLGMLLAALDQTIVATAGPSIQRDLDIAPSLYTWITTSYLVASTVCVPIWGKLSDAFGRRRILLAGIGVFLLGSALCGLSASATQLILFRAVQGIGSAALFTSAFTVIADLFTPAERGRFQGIFGAAFGLSSVIGPMIGGFVTDTVGWHWCFFVNLPVGAIATTFILARMPPLRRAQARPLSLDVAGALTLALFAVPLLLALSLGRLEARAGEIGWPWLSWQVGALFGAATIGLVAFLAVEGRARDPIVDLKLLRLRVVAAGLAVNFLAGLAFLGAIVFLPLFMVVVAGASATSAGMTTLPLTMGLFVANIASGQIASRIGRTKPVLLLTVAGACAAFLLMALTLDVDTTEGAVAWRMFLLGLGMGPAIPLVPLTIQNAVPPAVIGAVTSLSTFFRQMGATMGLAVLGTVFAASLQVPGGGAIGGEGAGPSAALLAHLDPASLLAFKRSFVDAVARVFWFATAFQGAALVAVLLLPNQPLRGRPAPPPAAHE
ncbi:MAG: MFS transporter [Deltaproteobacteria bacterium]|nr:MFS transporter [Deltaproteobacteria bacterium]